MKQFKNHLIFTVLPSEKVLLLNFTVELKSIAGGMSDFGHEAPKCVS